MVRGLTLGYEENFAPSEGAAEWEAVVTDKADFRVTVGVALAGGGETLSPPKNKSTATV